jgi:hypothetical protein
MNTPEDVRTAVNDLHHNLQRLGLQSVLIGPTLTLHTATTYYDVRPDERNTGRVMLTIVPIVDWETLWGQETEVSVTPAALRERVFGHLEETARPGFADQQARAQPGGDLAARMAGGRIYRS